MNPPDTPLHKAAQFDNADELQRLIKEEKCDVDSIGPQGRSPLHRAVAYNARSSVQILLDLGAEVNLMDRDGRTPLHIAASQGFIPCLELLLSHGNIHINARDKNGATPLIVAASNHKLDSMTLLAQRGADITVQDQNGKTAVDICKELNLKTPRILNELVTRKKREERFTAVNGELYRGQEILKVGMLWKRGSGVSAAWKHRLFVLTKKPELVYFSEKDVGSWKEKKAKGTIPILNHTFLEYVDKSRSSTFKIVPDDQKLQTYFVGGDSQQESEEWIRTLRLCQNPAPFISKVIFDMDKELRSFFINPQDLQIGDQVLGRGGNGIVKKGLWLGSTEVAVKSLRFNQEEDEDTTKLFFQEIRTISELRHINIVSMFGYSLKDDSLCLVTEFIPNGDLSKYIFDTAYPIDLPLKIGLGLAICRGMAYLHSKNIVHRDLKPANILVENLEESKIRVCDFGLSVALNNTSQESIHASPAYEAPEMSLHNHDRKVDIYSFAVVLWEIDTRTQIWSDLTLSVQIFNKVRDGERPPIAAESIFKELITSCWDNTPSKRPEFRVIFDELTTIQKAANANQNLFVPTIDPEKSVEANILQVFGDKADARWEDFVNTLVRIFNTRPERVNAIRQILAIKGNSGTKRLIRKETWQMFLQWFTPLRIDDGYEFDSKNKGPAGGFTFDDIYEICSQPWFFGFIQVDSCTDILNKKPVGTYMLRFSSKNPGMYTLSVATTTKVAHWRISCEKVGGTVLVFKCGANQFRSLTDLFEHFSIHPLKNAEDGSPIQLSSPCRREERDFYKF